MLVYVFLSIFSTQNFEHFFCESTIFFFEKSLFIFFIYFFIYKKSLNKNNISYPGAQTKNSNQPNLTQMKYFSTAKKFWLGLG